MSDETVVIFGAGATKACGGPLTNEILPRAVEMAMQGVGSMNREEYLSEVDPFLVETFHLPADWGARAPSDYPPLPLLLALVDTALGRGDRFGGRNPDRLRRVREGLEYLMYAVLEEDLRRIRDHYHDLMDRLWPGGGPEPVAVSLNYDIIADNTMIRLGEERGREAFPWYGCDIATEFYRTREKYGRLFKLHGSMNWMYCPECRRLDLGIGRTGRTAKLLDMLFIEEEEKGLDLYHRYTCHGAPCVAPGCTGEVRPVMITPTHQKDYRNPHIAQSWYEAERALREAGRAVFVGYSLPENDTEVVYLLKRGLGHLPSERITVIEYDPDAADPDPRLHPVGQRYRALFGPGIHWRPEGLEAWVQAGAIPA